MKKIFLLPLLLALFSLHAIAGAATQLSFKNPSLISGSNKQVGAVYRFSQVSSNTDALVKILRFNNGASVAVMDVTGTGLADAFQPKLRTGNNNDSSVDFEITFVKKGTSEEKAITFNATGADIDGDGGSIKEYISLSTPISYSVESPTRLVVSSDAIGLHVIPNTAANVRNITVTETKNIITASYKNTSKIVYRVGAKNAKKTVRYNSLYFKDVSYTNENVITAPTHRIEGTVFEDISGDLFADGDEQINNASGDQVSKNKVNVYLYRDNGNSQIDAGDTLVASADENSIRNGRYHFDVEDGDYFVVVDSKTFPAKHTYNTNKTQEDVWAEQTWGSKGGFCADGNGGTKVLSDAGACYGGRRADVSDDITHIENAEHLALVKVDGEDISGIDFGFSFNVMTSIGDNDDDQGKNHTAQGTLRQFVQNANAISGNNTLVFHCVSSTNDANSWKLTLQEPLPIISDDGFVLDGGVVDDSRIGHSGDVVGVGDTNHLPIFKQAKLEIDANDQIKMVDDSLGGVFVIDASNVTLKHIALYNGAKDNEEVSSKVAGILVQSGSQNTITENLLGITAMGSDPGAGKRLVNAIYQNTTSATVMTDNYIGYTVYGGIWAGNNAYIAGNELHQSSHLPTGDAITTEESHGDDDIIIENNWIEGAAAYGIESWESPSIVTIRNNTLIANGQDTSQENQGENGAIRVFGRDNVIEKNVIINHPGAGIVIVGDKNQNQISQNSIYHNGGLGVDIDKRASGNRNGDGVNANDGLKKSNSANEEIDYPVFTHVAKNANTLHLEGYIGTASKKIQEKMKVEVFKADDDGNNKGEIEKGDGKSVEHGEGRWFIADFDTQNDGTFKVDVTIPSTVVLEDTDLITAIATDTQKNSSEFGANYALNTGDTIPKAKLEYRMDACTWSGVLGDVTEQMGHETSSKNRAYTQEDAIVHRSGNFAGKAYVDAGDVFNDINDTFTMMAWVKPAELTDKKTNHNTKNTFLAKASDAANDNLEIGVNPDGSLHLYLDTKKKDKFTNIGSGISTDSWHFIAVRYDKGKVHVTIDTQDFTDTTTWNGGGNLDKAEGSPFTIGASLHVDNYFHGSIDEVKVFDAALDDAAINAIYNNEKSGKNYDGSDREALECPVAEYRFDACMWYGKGSDVVDSVDSNDGQAYNDAKTVENGKINRAASFLGEGYIEADADFSLQENFTIAFWMNPADANRTKSYMSLMSKQIEIYLTRDDKLHVNFKNGTSVLDTDTFTTHTILTTDSWTHIVLEKKDSTFTCYINGREDSHKHIRALTDNGLDTIMIAKTNWDGAEQYQGKIDELLFFTTAIDKDKRDAIYQNERDGKNYDGSQRTEKICLSPIGCKEEAIVIDDAKYLFEVDLATGAHTRYEMHADAGGINGFGMSKKDGFIWGYNQTKKDGTLIRVGKKKDGSYAQEIFGPIDDLVGKSFYIGDIDDGGQLYLYGKGMIYIIDIDPASDTFLTVLDSFSVGNSIQIADMAFNPIDKQLYAIESDNDLYKIDVETKRTTLIKKDAVDTGTDTYGSSFFDAAGFFYAIKNSTRAIYRIDLSDKDNIRSLQFSSLVNNDVHNVNIDGGRCNDKPIFIDYGDAPDSSAYNQGDGTGILNYKTLTSDNGPRHKIDEKGAKVFFGKGLGRDNVTSESDAKEGNRDDDNGIVGGIAPLYTSMYHYALTVAVENDSNKTANVVGWIDFNRNGRFELSEGVKKQLPAQTSENMVLRWNVPDTILEGVTYARFRITTDDMDTVESDSYGIKNDGEVEDYEITVKRGSLYDAWDVDSNLTARKIHTKKVNEDISLNIASVSRDGENLIENTFTNIKAGLFSKDDNSMLHNFVDVNFSAANPYRVDFGKISKASKYSYVKITYLNESNITKEVNATDAFAIRPNRYDMRIVAPKGLVAGREFNITIDALDALGHRVSNYDENVTVYGLDYNETLVSNGHGCVRGELTAPKAAFVNGSATIVSHYDNVGQLDLKVYEIQNADTEFAVVDKDDGSNEDRYIDKDTLQTDKFSPSNIAMTWDFKNGSNRYTFYDSNLTEMAAPLTVSIRAQDDHNATVSNFRDGCYAEDILVKVDFTTDGVAQTLTPVTDQTVSYSTPLTDISASTFAFKVLKGDFSDGEGNETVRLNFQRARNIAKEPMKLTISDVNASIAGGVSISNDEEKSATFVYLRAHVTDQSTIGKSIIVPVDYEVYSKSSNKALFDLSDKRESKDSINWYIIPSDVNMDYTEAKSLFDGGITVTHTSRDAITIEVEKLPHSNTIKYTPRYEYLLYDRYQSNVKYHHFKVRFNPEAPKWTGRGALGKTVDQRAYKGNGLQKIDW